jgi:hypothetical protein
VLEGAFAPPEQEVPTVGSAFSRILSKALGHHAQDRYASMVELAAALEAELATLGISDVQEELARFFKDTAAYREELPKRLSPRLFALGKEALAREDVVGAAAHLNRALAFAPGDAAILAHVAKLTRRGKNRALMQRVGMACGAVALVALVAFGTRALGRRHTTTESAKPQGSVVAPIAPDPSAVAPPPLAASSAPSPFAPPRVVLTAQPIHIAPILDAGTAKHGDRKVRFIVNPKSTLVSVDGGVAEQGAGLVKTLSIGTHTYSAFVDHPCCNKIEPRSFEVMAAPDGAEGTEQIVAVSLGLKDATIVSIGPASAQLRCPTLGVVGPGDATQRVKMNQLEDTGDCLLFDGGREIGRQTITVKAGISSRLVWSVEAP